MNDEIKKNPYDVIDDFAEMLEPLAVIVEDDEIKELAKDNSVIRFAILAIKKHKKEVVDFLALYQNTPVEELQLTKQNLIPTFCTIIKDQQIREIFFS